jgi:hypothetical protein
MNAKRIVKVLTKKFIDTFLATKKGTGWFNGITGTVPLTTSEGLSPYAGPKTEKGDRLVYSMIHDTGFRARKRSGGVSDF